MNKSGDIRTGGSGGDKERRSPAPGPSRRRYHRDALGAVLAMLGTISPEAASLFAAIVAIRGDRRGPDERALDRAELVTMLKLEGDKLDRYLVDVGDQIDDATGLKCLDTKCRAALLANAHNAEDIERRPTPLDLIAAATAADADEPDTSPPPVLLGRAFVEILDAPHPPAAKSASVPRLDRPGQADVAMVEAIVRAGVGGHLAVRRTHVSREAGDLAAILGTDDRKCLVYDGPGSLCLAAILRAELHAGERPVLMIVDRHLLIADATSAEDSWDEPVAREPDDPAITSFARDLTSYLVGARGLYLWSVPDGRAVPYASLPWIGACLGPIRFDPAWARGIVAGHLGIAGEAARSQGVAALARRSRDPRDVGAMATMARAIAAVSDGDLDRACARIAGSFVDDRSTMSEQTPLFDARLLVCGDEAHRLLAHAREAARNGTRLLVCGPPGGGKSAYVRELAHRMAGEGPVRFIGPADFLARAWGATERLVHDLWRRAAEDGAVLVVDEFDAVGGRRTPGDMTNNAMLVRSLTNAWLNAMDSFPGVPMLATTNDRAALDPAIQRRAAFVLEFGDMLSPAQERLAWRIVLGHDPPPNWIPIGAAVADFVLAKLRSRMLGTGTREALARGLDEARSARLGPGIRTPTAKPSRLH